MSQDNPTGALVALCGVLATLLVQVWLSRREDAREKQRESHEDEQERTRSRADMNGDILLRAIEQYRDRIAETERTEIKKDVLIVQLQTQVGQLQGKIAELEAEIERLLKEREGNGHKTN